MPFRFSLTVAGGNPLYGKISALLKTSLEKLRVACDIKELEFATLISQTREHRFQAACYGLVSGADPDTARNWFSTEAYQNGRNIGGYSNTLVDELFDRGARELDPQKRAQVYREIDRLVAQDHPLTFLAFRASFFAVSKDLRGFNFSPRGPFGYSPGLSAMWKKRR